MRTPAIWQVTAASVTGTSHHRDGRTCDDGYAVLRLNNAVLLAVTDGAGSAKCGGQGSQCAAWAATSYVAGGLTRRPKLKQLLLNTALHTREVLRGMAAANGDTMRDYATTLLLAVITERHIGTLQIGDGCIVVTDGESLTTLSVQQQRQYVNEVTFLTCSSFAQELHVRVIERANNTGIALCSDGVETLGVVRRSNAAVRGFFQPLFAEPPNPEELSEYLASPEVCKQTDDDKTIVIATRGG